MPKLTPQKIQLLFYRKLDRNIAGLDLMRVQWRWPVGMPLCRSLDRGLWIVGSTYYLTGRRIARMMFCIHDRTLVVLHAFIKKTQKTPDAELALARKRQKELKK
jgi:hypothetical protein